jgi:hypothetical protein
MWADSNEVRGDERTSITTTAPMGWRGIVDASEALELTLISCSAKALRSSGLSIGDPSNVNAWPKEPAVS